MSFSKTCTKCKTEKASTDFGPLKTSSDGLDTRCRACESTRKASYRQANAERVRAIGRASYASHRVTRQQTMQKWREGNLDAYKASQKAWRQSNAETLRDAYNLRRARKHANGIYQIKKRQLQALYASPCFYCGAVGQVTVDHIIPIARGGVHSIGNLVAACQTCNSSKKDRTIMEWKLSKKVVA